MRFSSRVLSFFIASLIAALHGEDEVHATLVGVDTDDPDLFTYKPVYIPENIPPFKPAAKP